MEIAVLPLENIQMIADHYFGLMASMPRINLEDTPACSKP